MGPYHLAKILNWAGELSSRKRFQKVLYLLQTAGCKSIDARFILHHYGPYSPEVASLIDQMSVLKLVEERTEPGIYGLKYIYTLTDRAKSSLVEVEKEKSGKAWASELEPFEQKAREFVGKDLSILEYGATIVYFYRNSMNWEDALTRACHFKKLDPLSAIAKNSLEFAKSVVD